MTKSWNVTVGFQEKEVIIESDVFDAVVIESEGEAAKFMLDLAQAFHVLGWLGDSGELAVKVTGDVGKA